MTRYIVPAAILCFASTAGSAQTAKYAPLPPQLATAKTAFLSNRCEENYKTCSTVYNNLYSGLISAGKYQLLASPSSADLIFEIHLVTRTGTTSVSRGVGGSESYANLTLTILDNQTHVALWTITEPYEKGAEIAVLFDLQIVAQPNATAGPPQHVPGYTKDSD